MKDVNLDNGKYPAFLPLKEVPAPGERGSSRVLRRDLCDISSDMWDIIFGSNLSKFSIRSVTFVDSLADMPEGAWDLSEEGDGSVMAWVTPGGTYSLNRESFILPWNEGFSKRYHLYIGAEGGVRTGASCERMFWGWGQLEQVTFGNALDTGLAEDMTGMFFRCQNLARIDLRSFDTSNVVEMDGMFCGCIALKDLLLPKGFVQKKGDTRDLFTDCPAGSFRSRIKRLIR